ncbi:Kinesin-like protein KIF3B [Geodia barretti]|uniref:Kinesin-like protein KIF3B n=1 Tax=Geodia barretti TaxID=519541 RepID=A0AA35RD65_GEOBA|nr:Kinesin-like protein KIF3B [Geodia barretti]
MVAASGNPRYLAENILRVELDMPNRTTRDYECPSVAPSLRAALSRAMAEEEGMTVDAGSFTLSQKPRLPRTKTRLRQSSEPAATPTTHFPTRRGLVTPSV